MMSQGIASRITHKKEDYDLVTPWPVAAALLAGGGVLTGSAATGIAEFFGRRAFITVAGGSR